jgi:hypothetical protein
MLWKDQGTATANISCMLSWLVTIDHHWSKKFQKITVSQYVVLSRASNKKSNLQQACAITKTIAATSKVAVGFTLSCAGNVHMNIS